MIARLATISCSSSSSLSAGRDRCVTEWAPTSMPCRRAGWILAPPAERGDVVVGGEPAHLPLEAVTREMKAGIAGGVAVGRHHVVVAEDQAGIADPAAEPRHAQRAKATIVERGRQAHAGPTVTFWSP